MSHNHSERMRRETNLKINSLLRLLEALDTVEKVLGQAVAQFKRDNGQKPFPLTRDIIEPSSLGIHFTYFKDYPLSVSTHLLQRVQAKSKSELSALRKKKERLKKYQGAILTMQDHNYKSIKEQGTLPKIDEGCLCTPQIGLGKVRRLANGLFWLTEEYTYLGEQEVDSVSASSPSLWQEGKILNKKGTIVCNSNSKLSDKMSVKVAPKLHGSRDNACEQLYTDIIDFTVMEKLNAMDPKARGDYTAQFYKELFQENDWLLPVRKKDSASKALHSFENKEQSITSNRETVRKRNRGRDKYSARSSDLARLFSGKKKDRHITRERKLQTQRAVQCQEVPKDQLISKNKNRQVLRRRQRAQQAPETLQKDIVFSKMTMNHVAPRKNNASIAEEHSMQKFLDSI